MADLVLQLGVKTDPVEYRFSYPWLFEFLAGQGIRYVQLGTFFEIYRLPDAYFHRLRSQAEGWGIEIASVFTAHRELGGFFVDEPGWEATARDNFERLIQVGSLVGARSVGSNPGAVYRDRMEIKSRGVARYLRHMRELMGFARDRGVEWLTIEPMSCLAEPPTLPEEIAGMAEELASYHGEHPGTTARVGYCADIAHGYVDPQGQVRYDHLRLLEATLPHLYELHLKNTDASYSSTFGFGPAEREAGIVQIERVRRVLLEGAGRIPVDHLAGYLEIGGPKLGRDYSDQALAEQLRQSLGYLKRAWCGDGEGAEAAPAEDRAAAGRRAEGSRPAASGPDRVRVAPSIMCVDPCHLAEGIGRLEAAGADLFHLDVADGHFVPNLLLGLDVIQAVRGITSQPLDAHLMVEHPDDYLERLAGCGTNRVSVHAEACRHLDRTLGQIRQRGMKAGVALNPATPLECLRYVVQRLDFVLLMTVNPGFAGGRLVPGGIRKIADCRRFLAEFTTGPVEIMVDGNVSFQNIPAMVAAGADILVAGTSSWFHPGESLEENVQRTRQAIASGWEKRGEAIGDGNP